MPFPLRVATLNLRHDADRWPERLPLVVAGLVQERPHLVGLQEVFIPIDQAGALVAAANGALHPIAYECRLQPKVDPEGEREGLAILSRLPIEGYGWLDLAGGARVAQRVRVRLPAGALVDLYNTHLHHSREADGLRREQAARLLAWIGEQSRGALPILVGDMNALPDSPAIEVFRQGFASAFELAHRPEPAYTFPTPLVQRADPWQGTLDYILLPRDGAGDVRVVEARLAFDRPAAGDPSLYPSDHYGLIAEITFPSDAGACDPRGSGL